MINIPSKLPNAGSSIFSTMTALANTYDAVNLSQGFPDFDCSPKLIELVGNHMKHGRNQYAPMEGVLPLREQIAHMVEDYHGMHYHPAHEITITAGATQAIFTAIACLIRPDDEVICFDPSYDCYAPAVDLCGGVVKTVALQADNNFAINWEEVKKLFSLKTKLIIINTPHNPTSTIFSERDMEQLIKLTNGTDIFIISDEVYDKIVFDGKKHISVGKYDALKERSFVISSFGKMFHITGWKIGYCLAPERLTQEFRKVHQYLVFSVNTPLQYALADYLKDEEYLTINKLFQGKRDFFIKGLQSTAFKPLSSSGSYFLLASYDQLSHENDVDFTKTLATEHQVASIPLSVFYKNKIDQRLIRFCFAKKQETLEKAIDYLQKVKF